MAAENWHGLGREWREQVESAAAPPEKRVAFYGDRAIQKIGKKFLKGGEESLNPDQIVAKLKESGACVKNEAILGNSLPREKVAKGRFLSDVLRGFFADACKAKNPEADTFAALRYLNIDLENVDLLRAGEFVEISGGFLTITDDAGKVLARGSLIPRGELPADKVQEAVARKSAIRETTRAALKEMKQPPAPDYITAEPGAPEAETGEYTVEPGAPEGSAGADAGTDLSAETGRNFPPPITIPGILQRHPGSPNVTPGVLEKFSQAETMEPGTLKRLFQLKKFDSGILKKFARTDIFQTAALGNSASQPAIDKAQLRSFLKLDKLIPAPLSKIPKIGTFSPAVLMALSWLSSKLPQTITAIRKSEAVKPGTLKKFDALERLFPGIIKDFRNAQRKRSGFIEALLGAEIKKPGTLKKLGEAWMKNPGILQSLIKTTNLETGLLDLTK